jgi:hypothetical protein
VGTSTSDGFEKIVADATVIISVRTNCSLPDAIAQMERISEDTDATVDEISRRFGNERGVGDP